MNKKLQNKIDALYSKLVNLSDCAFLFNALQSISVVFLDSKYLFAARYLARYHKNISLSDYKRQGYATCYILRKVG